MKLKKIASLMLAGIMAVSMLAGCKSGDSNSTPNEETEAPVSSDFTSTVLGKTSEATRDKLTVNADDKLDEAVAFVARNTTNADYKKNITAVATTWSFVTEAKKVMGEDKASELNYDDDKLGILAASDEWNFSAVTNDSVWWTMYIVSAEKSDDYIAKEIANGLDNVSDTMTAADCKYSVRVAKANIKAETGKDFGESVLIAVAVTVDNTTNNH